MAKDKLTEAEQAMVNVARRIRRVLDGSALSGIGGIGIYEVEAQLDPHAKTRNVSFCRLVNGEHVKVEVGWSDTGACCLDDGRTAKVVNLARR